MGKVVKLDTAGERQPGVRSESSARRRRQRSKTALVLGGGGFTGGVYEIGALRALDLLSVNRSVTQFDVYVGTSAGSFVAALTANGVTPEEMMRVVSGGVPAPFRDASVNTLLRPNVGETLGRAAVLPFRLMRLAAGVAGQVGRIRELTPLDLVLGLAEVLPSGLYTGAGVESYLREVLAEGERTNDFRLL